MSEGNQTLLRQWQMLRLIPRYPRKIEAGDITRQLHSEGYVVSKRTVERDLQSLSGVFPLALDDREKPYGWSWQKDAPALDVPGLAPAEALTFLLARDHLKPFFPAGLLSHLEPYFRLAEASLGRGERSGALARWSTKVATVVANQPLLSPPCDAEVVRAVHEALLAERQLEIDYRSRSAGESRSHRIHPLGLVVRGPISYLVCSFFDYNEPRLVAMHRIATAKVLEEGVTIPKGFTLQRFIEGGAFGFASRGEIKLVARFTADAAEHLHEAPLSQDQAVTDNGDGWVEIRATVLDTQQLLWWLLGFGDQVVVKKPAALRDAIAEIAAEMARHYA